MKPHIAALDPQLRRWAVLAAHPRTFTSRNVRVMRRLSALGKQRAVKGVTVSNMAHGRLFTPASAVTGRPALLWIHGGGYVIGRPEQDEGFASRVARDLRITVLAVRYRLAPEHPAPAQLDDCYAALESLAARDDVDPARIAIGGGSAGGGLAAGLAQLAQDRGGPAVAFQLLVYPMLDDRTCRREDLTARRIAVWNNASNRFGWASYLGTEPGSPHVGAPVVPGRRADLTGLPPTWIGVGDADLFHDEDLAYAARLRAAGVRCEVEVVPGAFHGFDKIASRTPLARAFTAAQIEALRRGLGVDAVRSDRTHFSCGPPQAPEIAPVHTRPSEPEQIMKETEELLAARAMRRAMLGDDYVDAQTADPDPTLAEFQDFVTSLAWGVWTREGVLSSRDRSLVVLAMTAAFGRMEEFRLHASATSRTGVSDAEVDELLFQIAAYCGAPAGVSAKRALTAVRAERDGAL